MTKMQAPPPEPLDAAERKLARALRDLPGGSPPAELDALILAAARRATQMPRARRERRWIIGLASAASAVLALGLLLRLHGLNRDSQSGSETAAPAASTIEPPPPPAADVRTSIEAQKDSTASEAAGGPANSPAATGNAAASPQPEEIMPPKPTPQAFPAIANAMAKALPTPPPPPPSVLTSPSPMAASAPPPAPAPAEAAPASSEGAQGQAATESDAMARRDAQVRQENSATATFGALSGAASPEQAAKKSAPAGELQSNEPTAQRSLDKTAMTGARLKAASPTLPPLADDAKLDADAWIVRIRARLAAGERDDAVSSLKSFVHAHPDIAIPEDLRPLLH